MALIELCGVTYRYPDPVRGLERSRRPALDAVDLHIDQGSRVAILGANGAGKSTLLLHLNGTLRPDAGSLRFEGAAIDYSTRGLNRLRQSVALVLQDPNDQLFAGTVRQDISFGPLNLGLDEATVRARVDEVIEGLGLGAVADLPPHQLSHGQRKRAALAGALAMYPRVLVLDEPTSGLDPKGIDALIEQLERLNASGMTIVVSTHDLAFAEAWAKTIVLLAEGRVDAVSDLRLLRDASAMSRVGLRAPRMSRTSRSDRVSQESSQHEPSAGVLDMRLRTIPVVRHGGANALTTEPGVELLDASASINPLGFPLWLRAEISRWLSSIQAYPDPNCRELRAEIAARHGCDPNSVTVGNGSSEILSWLPLVAGPLRWIVPVPSFGEYRRAPNLVGRDVLEIPLSAPGFALDWDALEAALDEPSIVVFGHPNNPTGTLLERDAFHSFRTRHPDSLFVIDEAFADFVDGFVGVWDPSATNLLVLRSMTKLLAIPGLRLGYALGHAELSARLREQLPPWSVNVLAQRVGLRALSDPDLVANTRQQTVRLRTSLATRLRAIAGLDVHETCANWLLLRLHARQPGSPEIVERCRKLGVALRCCSDFPGLGTEWLRVSLRTDAENARIADTLARVLEPQSPPVSKAPKRRRAIMLQGCSSDAGKSILVTALCRCLVQDGYRVAPFKAQNMSNNSGVAADGGEIGRAQVLQAEACRIAPDTRMNPILLKPNSDRGAQVVLRGRAIGHRDALEYHATKRRCLDEALQAFDELEREYDVVVCEGAGSAAEMNLRSADIVNMGFVTERPMPVLLVGDIDRGGVYASFVGHLEVMSEADRAHVKGFLVNRFRGVQSLLGDAHRSVEAHTGRPVLGVVPFLPELGLPDEDRLSLTSGAKRWGDACAPLSIAAVAGPHVSNFTDLDALSCESDVSMRLVERADELGQPDLILLLGSKNTIADFRHFERIGLTAALLRAHANGAWIVGICGGLQMLGESMQDGDGVESHSECARGLGLLPIQTHFAAEKVVRQVSAHHVASGAELRGYEIHHGQSDLLPLDPWLIGVDGARLGGALSAQYLFATYLHGLFDSDAFRRHFLDDLREHKGLPRLGRSARSSSLEPSLERLAKVFRESVDLPAIYRMMGLS